MNFHVTVFMFLIIVIKIDGAQSDLRVIHTTVTKRAVIALYTKIKK